MNAHKINAGEMPDTSNGKSTDFFFMTKEDPEDAARLIVELVNKKLPGYYRTPASQIQVLTPMQRGVVGATNLNMALQEALNPKGEGLRRSGFVYRPNDKVMQIKNNYQLEWEMRNSKGFTVDKGVGVFNGDMGIITEINDYTEKITVLFDETKEVQYAYANLDELELAYAVTIHKSQGSEYPAVVMPILSGPRVLFHRNLLYTGVTRARNCLTIVGDRNMLFSMIQNVNEQRRYTTLAYRLNQIANESNEDGMDEFGL